MDVNKNILKSTISPIASSLGFVYIAYTAFCYLFFPKASDIRKIYDFNMLIIFEFLVLSFCIFLSVLGMFWRFGVFFYWLLCIVFFAIIMLNFQSLMIDATPIRNILICIVVTHLLDLFTLSEMDKIKTVIYYVVRMILYALLLIFCCSLAHTLPAFGLSNEFLEKVNYAAVKKGEGILVDAPHIPVIIGLLYYSILSCNKIYNLIAGMRKNQTIYFIHN